MKTAGAIIVTWNSEVEIGPCLDAVLPHVEDIVVVDNASMDRTASQVAMRPSVRWISNPANRGFAAAVNQGISALDTPYVLLLNPDSELLTGIEPLVEACREADTPAAAGKLVDQQGRAQAGFSLRRFPTAWALAFEVLGLNRLWPRNPVNRRYRCLDLDLDVPQDVEQPAGAFLLIRRAAWLESGGFDEGFHPLWFEEVDFLKRLRDRGSRVAYRPSAVARHAGGRSVEKISGESRQFYWYASLLRYSSKHFPPGSFRGICGVLLLGSVLRMVIEVLSRRSLRPLRVYGKVIRLACQRLVDRGANRGGRTPALVQR